jgi:hypothetical protein
MCCALGCTSVALLLVFLLPTIILFEVTLQNDLERKASAVEDAVINGMSLISESNSISVNQMLGEGSNAALLLALQRAEETRPDTPVVPPAGAVGKNMDYRSLFAPGEGQFVPRYGGGHVLIDPYRSSYHIAGKTPADISTFGAALNFSIGTRFALDFVPVDMFNQSGGIIGPLLTLYTCILSPPTLFVDVPARGDTGLEPGYGAYDCSADAWSQQVIGSSNPETVQFVAPYYEQDANTTIISFVIGVRPFSGTGPLIGTVGVDLAVTSIQVRTYSLAHVLTSLSIVGHVGPKSVSKCQ